MIARAANFRLGGVPTARLQLAMPMTPHGLAVRDAIVHAEKELEQLAPSNHSAIAGLLQATRETFEREFHVLHDGAYELELEAEWSAKASWPHNKNETDAIIAAYWQLAHDRELARALWLSFRLRCATWGAR